MATSSARQNARAGERARELAETINLRLRFRRTPATGAATLRLAADLLDSDHPAHQQARRRLYAEGKRAERLGSRDQRLLSGEHPGEADGRYRAACTYALRWGLPAPAGAAGRGGCRVSGRLELSAVGSSVHG